MVNVHLVESEGDFHKGAPRAQRKSVVASPQGLSKAEGHGQHRVASSPLPDASAPLLLLCDLSTWCDLAQTPQEAFPDPRTTSIMLCNHHHSIVSDIFITPKEDLIPTRNHSLISPPSASGNHYFVFCFAYFVWICLF